MIFGPAIEQNPEALIQLAWQESKYLTKLIQEYNDELVKQYAARLNGKVADLVKLESLRSDINIEMSNIEQLVITYAKTS